MGDRASDAAVKVAESKIKDYELGQLKKLEERNYAETTHWKRFWADHGARVLLSVIGFMAVSMVALLAWIYLHGPR